MPNLEYYQNPSRPGLRIGEIRTLAEQGLSRAEIGRRLGIRYNTIKALCHVHGINPVRPYADVAETLERVRTLAPQYTRAEIAERLGKGYSSVRNL